MKIGVTGHQKRNGARWAWVKTEIDRALSGKVEIAGYSSLAMGADQLFAERVIARGGHSIAVIPMKSYRNMFEGESAKVFDRLLSLSTQVDLQGLGSDETAFLQAGKWIVREVDLMIAIWDGESAEGKGGTADIVAYAKSVGRPLLHIDLLRGFSRQI